MKANLLPRLLLLVLAIGLTTTAWAAKPALRFHQDGTFKIVMMSDLQDGPKMDPRTTALMEKLLDTEQPDLVVIGGDCIYGGTCSTEAELRQALAAVAYPMEKRGIAWAIVFGNHDQEHYAKTKLDKAAVLKIYAGYAHNLNVRGDTRIHGAGNDVLLVRDQQGKSPRFGVWLLDSGEYAPESIGGYEWINPDQVARYVSTSQQVERLYGHKLPGLMYFHIPLREFAEMTATGKFTGDRNENESASRVNSGLFAAVLERGDVKGIFCGHDHENNYVGEWMGVQLGFDTAVGYATYNLEDSNPRSAHSRGARVFLLSESDPWHYQTWMRFKDGTRD